MTVRHYVWAQNVEPRFDSQLERSVFLELAYLADSRGVVRRSQAEMAERMVMSERHIKRVFKTLDQHGFLTRLQHGRYLLNIASIEGGVPTAPALLDASVEDGLRATLRPDQAIAYRIENGRAVPVVVDLME